MEACANLYAEIVLAPRCHEIREAIAEYLRLTYQVGEVKDYMEFLLS